MQQDTPRAMEGESLRRHMFATYSSLRVGMMVIAVLFPIILYLAARLEGVHLQGSMSAYYWASMTHDPPSRIWFVGGLFAIAACLYLYKGFSVRENVALNLAGLLAIGVAYFPKEWNCKPDVEKLAPMDVTYCVDGCNPHGFCAVMLFVCLAYVTFFRSRDTLHELKDERLRTYYKNLYWIATAVMLAAPLSAALLHVVFRKYDAYTYFIELTGIWAFAFYWAVKTHEMRHSQAEEKVLMGRQTERDLTSR